MTVNWDVIRRKGKQGLLNADESDALVELAESLLAEAGAPPGHCGWCLDKGGHLPECHVAILEQIRAGEPDIWFGPRPGGEAGRLARPVCDPEDAAEGKRRMFNSVERKFRRRVVAIQPWRAEVFRALPGGTCERIVEVREGVYDVYGAYGRNLRVSNGIIVQWEAAEDK